MSKTILDHLIETTGRLRCVVIPCTPFGNGEQGYLLHAHEGAADEARRIVTEFAGPPCEEPGLFQALTATDGDCVLPGDEAPSDTCLSCGWPRGEHGRAN